MHHTITIGEMWPATLELSNYLNRPVYDVYSCYNKNKGKGWGVIAKEMGIKPGSDQFKETEKSDESERLLLEKYV